MTGDPFDYRCERCGVPLLAPGVCDRDDCRTTLEAVRAAVAWCAGRLLRAGRWLGIVQ